jgi:hypothetical protein
MRLSVDAFPRYPFGRPGYLFDDVAQDDRRSPDMRRCPVSDCLGPRGAADLCAGSWCNLDNARAETCGGKLDRSETLVARANPMRLSLPPRKRTPLGTTDRTSAGWPLTASLSTRAAVGPAL